MIGPDVNTGLNSTQTASWEASPVASDWLQKTANDILPYAVCAQAKIY